MSHPDTIARPDRRHAGDTNDVRTNASEERKTMNHRKKASIAAVGAFLLCASFASPALAASEPEDVDAVDLLVAAQPTFAENIAAPTATSTELQGVEVTVSEARISLDSSAGGFSVEAPDATVSSSVTPVLMENAEALFAIQLDKPDAPTEYDFAVELPDGGAYQILDNGGAGKAFPSPG